MKLHEALNRSVNLLGVGIVALSGIAFLPEVFFETDWNDKIDDILLFILSLVAIWWYTSKNNRFAHSIVPVVFVLLGLVDKIMAVLIEFADKEAVGDDFGGLILFLAASIFVLYQYRRTTNLLTQEIGSPNLE